MIVHLQLEPVDFHFRTTIPGFEGAFVDAATPEEAVLLGQALALSVLSGEVAAGRINVGSSIFFSIHAPNVQFQNPSKQPNVQVGEGPPPGVITKAKKP